MKAPTARHVIFAGILAGLLAGCAGTPSAPTSRLDQTLQADIAQIETLAGQQRDAQLIELLRQLNSLSRYTQALELGAQYPVAPDSIEAYPRFQHAMALAEFRTGLADAAQTRITQALSEPQAFIGLADEIRLLELRAETRIALSQNIPALEDLVALSALQDSQGSIEALWQLAKTIPDATGGSVASGWVALAQAAQSTRSATAIRLWRSEWPDHPAMDRLPLELAELLNTDWPTASRVGLILPMTGALSRVGESVLDGVMHQQLSQTGPTLIVADSAQGVEAALAELRSQNVDLILGPLPRDQVDELLALNPEEAVLALNYSEADLTGASAPRALMGLSPEHTAADAARLMAADRPGAPLLLIPGDTLGERIASAYLEQWQQDPERPSPVIQRYLNDDQNQVVSDALGVSASNARHRALERQLGLDLEFTPRRRQDITSVYIYADSITAAQLKPLLAFYYAGSLPIWLADAALDENIALVRSDLNGARVLAMPWQAQEDVASNVLFELGADAWALSTALADKTLLEIPGRTGNWTLDGSELRRTLTPIRITSDGYEPLERVVEQPDAG